MCFSAHLFQLGLSYLFNLIFLYFVEKIWPCNGRDIVESLKLYGLSLFAILADV